MYFIPVGGKKGKQIANVLNSTPVRAFISSYAERARGRFFRNFSWTVALVPLPNQFDDLPTDLTDEKEIDDTVGEAYGLDSSEMTILKEYQEFVWARTEESS